MLRRGRGKGGIDMPLKGHDPGGVVSVGASRQARHLAGAPPPLHFELARNAPRHASTTGVGLFGVPTGLRNQGPFPALPSRPPRGWSRLLRVWPAAKARLVSCVVWSAALSRASKLDSPLAAEGGPTWPVTKPLALLLVTASFSSSSGGSMTPPLPLPLPLHTAGRLSSPWHLPPARVATNG